MENEQAKESNQEVYTQVVKAGKRTYFIDVKSTKSQDHYITITESKKITQNGKELFQKHKIFLYKEDFEKFLQTLTEVMDKAVEFNQNSAIENIQVSDIQFEDLD